MAPSAADRPVLDRIGEIVQNGRRFLVTSHARPDGDSIGSQTAMALALDALGKEAHIVNRDPAPGPYRTLPGVARTHIADRVDGEYDAVFFLECSDWTRPGVAGVERGRLVNIDHHPGNTGYGEVRWIDETAAACAEMTLDLVTHLGAPLTQDIALLLYVGILTDTGGFMHSNITGRTFDACRRLAGAGVDPAAVAELVYKNDNPGKLRLYGAVLNGLRVEADGRFAVMYVDAAMLERTGGSQDDLDGLVNLPLSVRDIRASAFFKRLDGDEFRVSLRSKGAVDVGDIARRFGGGGHRNAAGCTVAGRWPDVSALIESAVADAIARGATEARP